MIMEAEKSHDLLPASWRTRKASDTIQSKPEALRTRSSDVQGQKMDMPAQGERIHSSIFCSMWVPNRLDYAPHVSEGTSALLSLLIQMLIFPRNSLTDTPRNNLVPANWAKKPSQGPIIYISNIWWVMPVQLVQGLYFENYFNSLSNEIS